MKNILFITILLISSTVFSQTGYNFEINSLKVNFNEKAKIINYNKNAHQYFFKLKKSKTLISVSIRNKEIFKFHNDSLSDDALIKKYYNWEYDYWTDKSENKLEAKVEKIRFDSINNFIIWKLQITDERVKDHKWTYFITGIIKSKITSLNIKENNKFSEDDSINKLIEIYNKIE